MNKKISPVVVGAALKSMRNTDFDMQTAMCEVIDNSLQADAKNVKIHIAYSDKTSRRKSRPEQIAFGDDGHGMGGEVLQYCLRLGYSGRYDDRKGIGRFGVGMTFAAISLCQRIDVYSREKRGNWHHTYLDISGLDKEDEPSIAPIIQKDLPGEYAHLVGDFGTLVIWSKMDRVDSPINEPELIHNMGRIYRKFIGEETIRDKKVIKNEDKRNLYINTQIIHSFDPLFVTKSQRYPDDKTTILDDETSFEWRVHDVDAPSSGQKRGTITIRTSLLPESWRQVRSGRGIAGSGRSADNNKRKVYENEGISILRNNREVAYGPIPHFLPRGGPGTEIDRFWSCEIDFEPTLDYWFSVRNIKIGARPLTDLKNELRTRIKPSIDRFRDAITSTMNEYAAKSNESAQGPIHGNKPKEEELWAITTPHTTTATEEEIEENTKQAAENVSSDKELQEEYIKKVTDPNNKYNIIEAHNMRADAPFFELLADLNTKVVHYNMNHTFFLHMYDIINRLNKSMNGDGEKIEMIKDLKGCFDNLFHAYSEAFYDLDDKEHQQSVGETIEELQIKWNLHLRKIYKNKQRHDQ